jgi:CBS domain-containing protein
MRCYEIMKKHVELVPVDAGASFVACRMREEGLGFMPVCAESGEVVGVVTDRDIALRVCADQLPHDVPVGRIMTRDVVACAPEDPVSTAEELMARHGLRHVVVVDKRGHLAGVLSLSDIAQHESPIRLARVVREVAAFRIRVESTRSPPRPCLR